MPRLLYHIDGIFYYDWHISGPSKQWCGELSVEMIVDVALAAIFAIAKAKTIA
jgi:hypothetical protein